MSNTVHIYTITYDSGAPYFERCLKSIQNQTYRNFKCHIYDNCSSEPTRQLIRNIISNDNRFVITYADTPIEQIYFEYVYNDIAAELDDDDFVTSIDADDEIHPDFLKETILISKAKEVDMVATASHFINNDTGVISYVREPDMDYHISTTQIGLVFPQLHHIMRTHWAKLISASTYKRMNVTNLVIPGYGADTLYTRELLYRCNSIYVTKKPLYNYYMYNTERRYTFSPGRIKSPLILYNKDISFLLLKTGGISAINREFLLNVYFAETAEVLHNLVENKIQNVNTLDCIHEIMVAEPTKIICRLRNKSLYNFVNDWICKQCINLNDKDLATVGEIMGLTSYIPNNYGTSSPSLYFNLLIQICKFWDESDKTIIYSKILEASEHDFLSNTDVFFRIKYHTIVSLLLRNDYTDALLLVKNAIQMENISDIKEITLFELGLSLAAFLSSENDFVEIKKAEIAYSINIESFREAAINELNEWLAIIPDDEYLINVRATLCTH